MKYFKSVKPEEFKCQPVHLIGRKWFLLTAGNNQSFNTMTCAWGGIGFLWNRPVVFIFVRPQRYTFEFTEKHSLFTLSFFDNSQREALNVCGTQSGRNIDKMAETGLIPIFDHGTIYFEQSEIVFKCRKIYQTDLCEESMVLPEIMELYPERDFHRMYVGEIIDIIEKE